MAALYVHILQTTGNPPKPEDPVFLLHNQEPLTRAQLNDELVCNAEVYGLPGRLFTSHSLRRGGASAYLAAGADPDDVARGLEPYVAVAVGRQLCRIEAALDRLAVILTNCKSL